MYRKINELRTAFAFKKMTMIANETQISVSYTKLYWNTANFTPLHCLWLLLHSNNKGEKSQQRPYGP